MEWQRVVELPLPTANCQLPIADAAPGQALNAYVSDDCPKRAVPPDSSV